MHGVSRALPLVEIEQHRGTLCHGAEQVAKLSERERADDVPVIRRDEDPDETLAREHCKVILPEVGHDLLELAVAHDGACELRGLHVAEDPLVPAELVPQLRMCFQDSPAEVA